MKKYFEAEQIISSKGSLSLDTANESAEIVTYYLRTFRGRKDLAQTLHAITKEGSFVSQLEAIRNLLAERKLGPAKEIIDTCRPENAIEECELFLETARYYYFVKSYERCNETLDKILSCAEALVPTWMTAFQLKGVALYDLGQVDGAIESLKKSIQLLDLIPHTPSGVIATAHLIKILSEQQRFEEAKNYICFLENTIEGIEQSEAKLLRLLPLMRAKFHFYKNMAEPKAAFAYLQESLQVAAWLDDHEMLDKCRSDLSALASSEQSSVLNGEGWTFLPNAQWLLVSASRKPYELSSKPLLQQILTLLFKGPISEENFFSQIWGLNYKPEKHSPHVRATLSKLRKLLPVGALKSTDGVVVLK